MKMIPFRPAERYMLLQLAQYFLILVLSELICFRSLCPTALLAQFALIVLIALKALRFASVMYFLTPDGLIISKGLWDKHIYWRDISVFCRLQRDQPGLCRRLHLSHLRLGLSGPPAERITLYGVDDRALYEVITERENELNHRLDFFERFDWVPKSA